MKYDAGRLSFHFFAFGRFFSFFLSFCVCVCVCVFLIFFYSVFRRVDIENPSTRFFFLFF